VHIGWFDPDNPVGSTITPNGFDSGPRDNYGTLDDGYTAVLKFDGSATLTLHSSHDTPPSKAQYYYGTMQDTHAGDDFILVAHPNAGIVDTFVLENDQQYIDSNYYGTVGRTLLYPEPSILFDDYAELPSAYQSSLTVWRTLHVEIDQLVRYGLVNGQPANYTWSRRPTIGDIAVSAYADACIVLHDIGEENTVYGWQGYNYQYMLGNMIYLVTPVYPSTRQLPLDFSPTYWTNYTIAGWYQGSGGTNCHPLGLYNKGNANDRDGSDRTYLWTQKIDDSINLYLQNPSPGDPPVTSDELRNMLDSLVFAHEIGHTFCLNEWNAVPNIMHNQIDISALLTNDDYFKFLDGQIQFIQSRTSAKGLGVFDE